MITELNEEAFSTGIFSSLTWAQFICLEAIGEIETPTISALAKVLLVSKPTVTNTVNNLVEAGYVNKIQSLEDRRVYFVKATKKGMKIIAAHVELQREFVKELIEPLTSAEVTQMITLFEKIVRQHNK
ncbi:MAG: MarR family transcriptional regulator [Bacillota bacterium]|nr:MarR family transcriptional regulator [Bacillota bacterium]